MSTHFPECPNDAGSCCPWRGDCTCQCICDVLRACEARVLDAAREAVKHLQHSDDCYYAEGVLCHCEIKSAITAIDALRKEPQ